MDSRLAIFARWSIRITAIINGLRSACRIPGEHGILRDAHLEWNWLTLNCYAAEWIDAIAVVVALFAIIRLGAGRQWLIALAIAQLAQVADTMSIDLSERMHDPLITWKMSDIQSSLPATVFSNCDDLWVPVLSFLLLIGLKSEDLSSTQSAFELV